MYKTNLTACIKVNGKILRESDDLVTLPFGSEYSIFIKNLNSVRAQVKISVDGTDATDGTSLVIAPNSSIELERFIKSGNLNTGNRFKFISRTEEIEKHRGIGSDDGLIRVEAWREVITQHIPVPRPEYYDAPYPAPWPRPVYPRRPWYPNPWGMWRGTSGATNNIVGAMNMGMRHAQSGGILRGQQVNSNKMSRQRPETERGSVVNCALEQSDAGITVPGSESHQCFVNVAGFPIEMQSTVIILHLRGRIGEIPVVKPVTIKAKPKCVTCGKANKSGMEFCGKCGTALAAYA